MSKINVVKEQGILGEVIVTVFVGDKKLREVFAVVDEEAYAEDVATMRLLLKCTELKQFDSICKEYMIPVATF